VRSENALKQSVSSEWAALLRETNRSGRKLIPVREALRSAGPIKANSFTGSSGLDEASAHDASQCSSRTLTPRARQWQLPEVTTMRPLLKRSSPTIQTCRSIPIPYLGWDGNQNLSEAHSKLNAPTRSETDGLSSWPGRYSESPTRGRISWNSASRYDNSLVGEGGQSEMVRQNLAGLAAGV